MNIDEIEAAAQWPGEVRDLLRSMTQGVNRRVGRCPELAEQVKANEVQLDLGRTTILDVAGLQPNAAIKKLRYWP